jgi:hypothetical protein
LGEEGQKECEVHQDRRVDKEIRDFLERLVKKDRAVSVFRVIRALLVYQVYWDVQVWTEFLD